MNYFTIDRQNVVMNISPNSMALVLRPLIYRAAAALIIAGLTAER